MGNWLEIHIDNPKPAHINYGLIHLGSASAPEVANNILVFGGKNDLGSIKDDSMTLYFSTK